MNRSNTYEIKRMLSKQPLLTDGWLIIVNVRDITDDLIRELDKEENTVVYVTRSSEEFDNLSTRFLGLQIKFGKVNNLDPPYSEIEEYVKSELGISEELAKYLCRRHRYFPNAVFESVERLRGINKLTREVIRKYTESSSEISYNSLFDYIIGVGDKITFSQVSKLVWKYRYGISYMANFILKTFNIYLRVYDLILSGEVSLENYKEYYQKNRDSFRDCSEYMLKRILDSFPLVSYDKLYFLKILYEKEIYNGISVESFMRLIRISKRKEA